MNNIQANCNTDKHLFRDNCLYIETKGIFYSYFAIYIRHIEFHLSNRAFILNSIQNNLDTKNYSFLEFFVG